MQPSSALAASSPEPIAIGPMDRSRGLPTRDPGRQFIETADQPSDATAGRMVSSETLTPDRTTAAVAITMIPRLTATATATPLRMVT